MSDSVNQAPYLLSTVATIPIGGFWYEVAHEFYPWNKAPLKLSKPAATEMDLSLQLTPRGLAIQSYLYARKDNDEFQPFIADSDKALKYAIELVIGAEPGTFLPIIYQDAATCFHKQALRIDKTADGKIHITIMNGATRNRYDEDVEKIVLELASQAKHKDAKFMLHCNHAELERQTDWFRCGIYATKDARQLKREGATVDFAFASTSQFKTSSTNVVITYYQLPAQYLKSVQSAATFKKLPQIKHESSNLVSSNGGTLMQAFQKHKRTPAIAGRPTNTYLEHFSAKYLRQIQKFVTEQSPEVVQAACCAYNVENLTVDKLQQLCSNRRVQQSYLGRDRALLTHYSLRQRELKSAIKAEDVSSSKLSYEHILEQTSLFCRQFPYTQREEVSAQIKKFNDLIENFKKYNFTEHQELCVSFAALKAALSAKQAECVALEQRIESLENIAENIVPEMLLQVRNFFKELGVEAIIAPDFNDENVQEVIALLNNLARKIPLGYVERKSWVDYIKILVANIESCKQLVELQQQSKQLDKQIEGLEDNISDDKIALSIKKNQLQEIFSDLGCAQDNVAIQAVLQQLQTDSSSLENICAYLNTAAGAVDVDTQKQYSLYLQSVFEYITVNFSDPELIIREKIQNTALASVQQLQTTLTNLTPDGVITASHIADLKQVLTLQTQACELSASYEAAQDLPVAAAAAALQELNRLVAKHHIVEGASPTKLRF